MTRQSCQLSWGLGRATPELIPNCQADRQRKPCKTRYLLPSHKPGDCPWPSIPTGEKKREALTGQAPAHCAHPVSLLYGAGGKDGKASQRKGHLRGGQQVSVEGTAPGERKAEICRPGQSLGHDQSGVVGNSGSLGCTEIPGGWWQHILQPHPRLP